MTWPLRIFAYNVTQRSIRVAARELRVAMRYAPAALRADLELTMERLQAHDDACDALLETENEPQELDVELGVELGAKEPE